MAIIDDGPQPHQGPPPPTRRRGHLKQASGGHTRRAHHQRRHTKAADQDRSRVCATASARSEHLRAARWLSQRSYGERIRDYCLPPSHSQPTNRTTCRGVRSTSRSRSGERQRKAFQQPPVLLAGVLAEPAPPVALVAVHPLAGVLVKGDAAAAVGLARLHVRLPARLQPPCLVVWPRRLLHLPSAGPGTRRHSVRRACRRPGSWT